MIFLHPNVPYSYCPCCSCGRCVMSFHVSRWTTMRVSVCIFWSYLFFLYTLPCCNHHLCFLFTGTSCRGSRKISSMDIVNWMRLRTALYVQSPFSTREQNQFPYTTNPSLPCIKISPVVWNFVNYEQYRTS